MRELSKPKIVFEEINPASARGDPHRTRVELSNHILYVPVILAADIYAKKYFFQNILKSIVHCHHNYKFIKNFLKDDKLPKHLAYIIINDIIFE